MFFAPSSRPFRTASPGCRVSVIIIARAVNSLLNRASQLMGFLKLFFFRFHVLFLETYVTRTIFLFYRLLQT